MSRDSWPTQGGIDPAAAAGSAALVVPEFESLKTGAQELDQRERGREDARYRPGRVHFRLVRSAAKLVSEKRHQAPA